MIREMKATDWDAMVGIYIQSLEKGTVTCGFRVIGYRDRIAKDRFGRWQNTTIMERRKEESE